MIYDAAAALISGSTTGPVVRAVDARHVWINGQLINATNEWDGFVHDLTTGSGSGLHFVSFLQHPENESGYQNPGYIAANIASAIQMAIERNKRIRAAGGTPLPPYTGSTNLLWSGSDERIYDWVDRNGNLRHDGPSARIWYMRDLAKSYVQFVADDAAEVFGKPLFEVWGIDDIVPYSPDRLAQIKVEQAIITQKNLDDQTIQALANAGADPSLIRDVSRATATDPVVRAVGNQIVDVAIPHQDVPDLGLRGDLSLPVMPGNEMTPEQTIQTIKDYVAGRIFDLPENYRPAVQSAIKELAQSRDYYYWKSIYPTVEFIASDNPRISATMWATPWPTNSRTLPPLVLVKVTPRQKPIPEPGFLAKYGSWIGLALSVIPIAGWAAGATLAIGTRIVLTGIQFALTAATSADLQSYVKAWTRPLSAFEPQYFPHPFDCVLPLNQAQIAVQQPWYCPMLVMRFLSALQTGDSAYVQAIMNDPSILPGNDGAMGKAPEQGTLSLDSVSALEEVKTAQQMLAKQQGSSTNSLAQNVPSVITAATGTSSSSGSKQSRLDMFGNLTSSLSLTGRLTDANVRLSDEATADTGANGAGGITRSSTGSALSVAVAIGLLLLLSKR